MSARRGFRRCYRGLFELYGDDPEAADRKIWGRRADPLTRRGFLGRGLFAMSAVLGAPIAAAQQLPAGLVPAALFTAEPFEIPGLDPGLIVLNDRPLSAETPAHLLDDEITPAARLFVRNNGLPPEGVDPKRWTLRVDGESVAAPRTFSTAELRREFPRRRYRLQLECAGNGRSEFHPPARGNQWTTGAIGCPEWTGVRVRDLLEVCGVKPDAVYLAFHGADRHLSGDASRVVISRGVPIGKALQDETLIAWALSGEDLPLLHGSPLRLVCGGWPGSASGKWLSRLSVRDRVHDGPKMGGHSYRVPCTPVAPGSEVADDQMCIIESMPVKSLVTRPASGEVHAMSSALPIRGHAWAGERRVARMDASIDFGQTWSRCALDAPANRLAWQRWRGEIRFPAKGYYEIWARATDEVGRAQPMVVPSWNPRGYLNNACHRIAVRVV